MTRLISAGQASKLKTQEELMLQLKCEGSFQDI